ncbi:MAG: recombinase RecA [Candidatus Eremiobacteraeota bacterium]|nr:recombinase RecA [Candidatus Eremiobacteraeota bacterium]
MAKVEVLDKQKAFERALQAIEKQCGKGSLMKLNDVRRVDANSIPTGFIGLDVALGVGGVPRGRVIEVFGPEGSGKSTLALEILAAVQKEGGNAVFIDAEHALDPQYATRLGVDLDSLFISQPDYGEQALFIADELIRSHSVDIIVIDSVAALTPKAEIEGEIGDAHVANQARMMSQALRRMTAQINVSGTIVIFINQIREKVGVMFGSNEVTPGGRALKFYSSIRLDVRKKESIKDGKTGETIGHRCKVSVKKNKVAPPFKECELELYFGSGFSRDASVLQEAITAGVVEKSGSWLSFREVRLGQGIENARRFLEDNPKVQEDILALIREKTFGAVEFVEEEDLSAEEDAA